MTGNGIKRAGVYALLFAFVVAGVFTGAQESMAKTFYKGKGEAKYVFLFIGDGMGFPQTSAAENFLAAKEDKQFGTVKLALNAFPAQGVTTTHAADRFITGSAAAATAIGCGTKTNIGVIGMDEQLRPVKSLAHLAKEKGMKVGIVSSVSIDHATPAAFYAHVPSRSQYHYIDMQLPESGFDYFAGGGMKDPTGKRKGVEPKGDALDLAKKRGYKVVNSREAFDSLNSRSGKVFAYNAWLQDSGALPYDMDRGPSDISLAEFTAKGIELLDNDDEGFFMMVEGGKIDWACHANDAAGALNDTLAFDSAVAEAVAFARKHPRETLIVVTGDHETGGLTLGFAGTKYASDFSIISKQIASFKTFEEVVANYRELFTSNRSFEGMFDTIENFFGIKMADLSDFELRELEDAFWRSMASATSKGSKEDYLLYGGYDPLTVKLTQIVNSKAGVAWTTYSHTGVPVATQAMGVGEDIFNGYYDNTDVATKIMSVMGVKPLVYMAADSANVRVAANN